MKVSKNLIGKKIWILPVGDDVLLNNDTIKEKITEVIIVKLEGNKGELSSMDSLEPKLFSLVDYSESIIKLDHGLDCRVYADLDEVDQFEKIISIRKYLRNNWYSIPENKLLDIALTLNIQ